MDEIAVRVDHVSKDFKLPHEKVDSIKNVFLHALKLISQHRAFEEQHALIDVNFEIKKGEFFGIVGRNGSGKSTLLKMIAGIYQPTKGSIHLAGKLVPFIELGVGFNPELTGRENVYLNGALMGFSKKEIDAKYEEVVEFAELEKFMDQKLKNYSTGMQVRLAFSLAIRAEADILLVDEVLAVGDADFQRKCFNYFKKLKKDKKTVVFVSHEMAAVREYCDRAVMIEKSEIVATGSSDKIANLYTRMFLEKKADEKETEDVNRWGNKTITYTKIKTTIEDKSLTITLEAVANANVEDLIFGFSVRDASGKVLFGSNSQIEKHKIEKLKKNQHVKVVWKTQNILNDGDYTIDLAIVRKNGEVCDWWEEAGKVTVLKEKRTPYSIYPEIEFNIALNQ